VTEKYFIAVQANVIKFSKKVRTNNYKNIQIEKKIQVNKI